MMAMKRKRSLSLSCGTSAPTPHLPLTTLLQLYTPTQDSLLKNLGPREMVNLAATSHYFQDLVLERCTPSLSLPLTEDQVLRLQDLGPGKPVLRLQLQPDKHFGCQDGEHRHTRNKVAELLRGQIALLDLSKLQEVSIIRKEGCKGGGDYLHGEFTRILTSSGQDLLNVKRFDFDCSLYPRMVYPNLEQVSITCRNTAQLNNSLTRFIDTGIDTGVNPRMRNYQHKVAIKISILSLKLDLLPSYRPPRILKMDHLKKIIVAGPCALQFRLRMPELLEVELQHPSACHRPWNRCLEDAAFHKLGVCSVDIRSVFDYCPKVKKFGGVSLEGLRDEKSITFENWLEEVKKRAFALYSKIQKDEAGLSFKKWEKKVKK